MIGYIGTGSSFFDCIRYCLEDKRELSEEQKQQLAQKDNLRHKDRAEVLLYNKCFGVKEKLKADIRHSLENVRNFAEFEQRIQALGYKLIKGRRHFLY
jgi:hypothetical protein